MQVTLRVASMKISVEGERPVLGMVSDLHVQSCRLTSSRSECRLPQVSAPELACANEQKVIQSHGQSEFHIGRIEEKMGCGQMNAVSVQHYHFPLKIQMFSTLVICLLVNSLVPVRAPKSERRRQSVSTL